MRLVGAAVAALRRRPALFCLAAIAAVSGCTTSTAGDTTGPTGGSTTAAPSTTPGTTSETTATTIAEELVEGEVAVFLEELGIEIQSWGVSESSWDCIETGLIEGGYVDGLEDVGFIEALFFDEKAPLVEAPPEIERFMDGFFVLLADPQRGCLRPAEWTTVQQYLSANPIDYGFSTYGSDPTLDMLYDGCEAGSMADCDMLYLPADYGGEYEEFALTCGGRVEPIDPASEFCMSVMNDFSEEADLATQCESGFYVACDLLYLISSIGSAEEELAASCGGARDPDPATPCWLKFGMGSR